MNEFLTFLRQAAPYLVIPILIAYIYKWRHLVLPFKLYFVSAVLVATLSVLRAWIGPSNSWFYVSAFLGVGLFGFFFHTVLAGLIDTRIVWLCVGLIWAIIGWYVLQNGTQKFFVWNDDP